MVAEEKRIVLEEQAKMMEMAAEEKRTMLEERERIMEEAAQEKEVILEEKERMMKMHGDSTKRCMDLTITVILFLFF